MEHPSPHPVSLVTVHTTTPGAKCREPHDDPGTKGRGRIVVTAWVWPEQEEVSCHSTEVQRDLGTI